MNNLILSIFSVTVLLLLSACGGGSSGKTSSDGGSSDIETTSALLSIYAPTFDELDATLGQIPVSTETATGTWLFYAITNREYQSSVSLTNSEGYVTRIARVVAANNSDPLVLEILPCTATEDTNSANGSFLLSREEPSNSFLISSKDQLFKSPWPSVIPTGIDVDDEEFDPATATIDLIENRKIVFSNSYRREDTQLPSRGFLEFRYGARKINDDPYARIGNISINGESWDITCHSAQYSKSISTRDAFTGGSEYLKLDFNSIKTVLAGDPELDRDYMNVRFLFDENIAVDSQFPDTVVRSDVLVLQMDGGTKEALDLQGWHFEENDIIDVQGSGVFGLNQTIDFTLLDASVTDTAFIGSASFD
jgi:hypothetical protein